MIRFGKLAELTKARIRREYGRNAHLGGSVGLGIDVPESSDVDIFVPYRRKSDFDRAVKRIGERHPELTPRAANAYRDDKAVFTGLIDGRDADVAVGYGPRADRYERAYQNAKSRITDEYRKRVVDEKRRLKNAWLFPETRYKMYKRQVAKELGMKDAYF